MTLKEVKMLNKLLEMIRTNKEVDWSANDPAQEFAELEKVIESAISKQGTAIKCAYADLVGAYQAMQQQDYSVHDWSAHRTTIEELEEAFSDLITDPIELGESIHD